MSDAPQPELLPCPFCGGPAKAFSDGGRWFAVCRDEDAKRCFVGPVSDACLTQADAIAAWNRRSVRGEGEVRAKALEEAAKVVNDRVTRKRSAMETHACWLYSTAEAHHIESLLLALKAEGTATINSGPSRE